MCCFDAFLERDVGALHKRMAEIDHHTFAGKT